MEKIYKVAIDVMGSDNGPEMMVKGALKAIEANVDMGVVLVGDSEAINTALADATYDAERVEIIGASDVITNYDTASVQRLCVTACILSRW